MQYKKVVLRCTNMKKAQIQMSENVIVLFLFFILLAFGIVFYSNVHSISTQQTANTAAEGRGLEVAQQVMALPELQCTSNGVEISGCYDEESAIALNAISQDSGYTDHYYSEFGYATISIQELYPTQGGLLVIYNDTKPAKVITPTFVPFVLCNFLDPSGNKQCNFAVLEIETYD